MKTSSLANFTMRIFSHFFLIFCCAAAFAQALPQNSHKNPYGGGWECNRGFKQVGNECQKVQVPANAVLDILGHDWECARGFRNSGNQCVKVQIPANAGLDILGHDWECLRGFQRVGNECQKVQMPANAGLDILGHDWECKRGFKRVGNECVKLTIPVNASIDILGHDWICNKGFKRVASECQQMTDSEKKAEAERDKSIREEIKRRQARGARGNHCDSEYSSGANVCVTVKNAELDCSESYDRTSYSSCRVEVSLYVETDYRGRGYIDGRVKCEVSLSTAGSSGYESTQTNDERWNFSLYANDSSTRSLDIDFSFSSYDKIRKVRISDLTCRVRDLYVY
jgi:hypothetical protein